MRFGTSTLTLKRFLCHPLGIVAQLVGSGRSGQTKGAMRGIFAYTAPTRADSCRAARAPTGRASGRALARGGVPVAREVAVALGAPLDVIVVRKLGVPVQPELAMGAVGEDGVFVINPEVVRQTGVSAAEVAAVREREQAEVTARAALYRASRAREPLDGRVAVVVDDGIATGATARRPARSPGRTAPSG